MDLNERRLFRRK
jgi:predicted DNA binding CopG/RHH family protein